ncbi:MAG: hypothetical protein GY904_25460 [Planctomycetaceae bacterium]|nr:hypothetical protein [Planctomycetaceae bacterium]
MNERSHFRVLIAIPALMLGFAWIQASTCQAQANKQRGATVGGLIGAAVGGLIGDNNGEAGAGAAIGGVVGAVTGGVLGDATDKEQQAYQQRRFYQQQQAGMVRQQSAVSVNDVAAMARSGLSDQVIINQIQIRGVQKSLQVPDIISLHQQGVPENVITVMQRTPVGSPTSQPVRAQPRVTQPIAPVIVEEHYFVPHYPPPPYRYRVTPRHHYHHGFHFRFGH